MKSDSFLSSSAARRISSSSSDSGIQIVILAVFFSAISARLRSADECPINVRAHVFAADGAASCALYIWASLCWDLTNAKAPLANQRLRDADFLRQSCAAFYFGCVRFQFHAASLAKRETQCNSETRIFQFRVLLLNA